MKTDEDHNRPCRAPITNAKKSSTITELLQTAQLPGEMPARFAEMEARWTRDESEISIAPASGRPGQISGNSVKASQTLQSGEFSRPGSDVPRSAMSERSACPQSFFVPFVRCCEHRAFAQSAPFRSEQLFPWQMRFLLEITHSWL